MTLECFQVKKRKARKARNPRTGHQVNVPEKLVVTFKPGKLMEAKVQELEDTLATWAPPNLETDGDDNEDEDDSPNSSN